MVPAETLAVPASDHGFALTSGVSAFEMRQPEDWELLLDELDSEDSEDADDSELPDGLEDEGSGPVGRALVVQPPRAPTPARVAPPESRIRNSRRSDRCTSADASCAASSFSSVITRLPQCAEAFLMARTNAQSMQLSPDK